MNAATTTVSSFAITSASYWSAWGCEEIPHRGGIDEIVSACALKKGGYAQVIFEDGYIAWAVCEDVPSECVYSRGKVPAEALARFKYALQAQGM